MSWLPSILGFAFFLLFIVALSWRGKGGGRLYERREGFIPNDGATDFTSSPLIGADSVSYGSPAIGADSGSCSSPDMGSCTVDSGSSASTGSCSADPTSF